MSYAGNDGETCLDHPFERDPEKQSGRRLWFLLTVALLGVLITAGMLAGTPTLWARSLPPRKAESAEEKWRKTAAAFADTPAPVEHAELPAIQKLLERYAAALRNRDAAAVREAFDFGRMVQELERLGALKDVSLLERVLLPGQFGARMPNQFVANALFYEFDRFEIRRLDVEGENEVVVYARHWSALGESKYRWWMRKTDGRWRIFDFEELESVERFSDFLVASVRDLTPARAAAMQRAAASVDQVFRAIAEEDWAQAEQIIDAAGIEQLPPVVQTKLHIAQATVHIAFGRCEQALDACDRAAALSDMPILSYQRAVCYNALGRREEALAAAKQYIDRLGTDSDVLLEMGVALAWLGRSDEALEAYRRGLRNNPDDPNLLLELGVLLPADAKREVGEHFARMAKPGEQFESLCDAFLASDDTASLAAMVEAYRTIEPEDPLLAYYDATLKLQRGEHEAAAEQVVAALPRAGVERLQAFLELYLDAMHAAGKSLEAYARSPDPEHAFDYLAARAVDESPDDELVRLIVAHRARCPDDPWLDYYTGQLAAIHEDWNAAIDAYRKGMRKLEGDEDAAGFRYPLSQAMIRAGRGLEAYRELGADRDAFTLLAWQLSSHNQPEQLRTLLETFEKDYPNEHTTPFWKAEVHFLSGEYAEVVRTIENNASILMTHDETRSDSEDRLIRSLIHLKRFEDADSYARAVAGRDEDMWYPALVAAARGDVAETERLLERCAELYYGIYDFYSEPILAAALETEPFRTLREKYPHWDDPVEAPSPLPPAEPAGAR